MADLTPRTAEEIFAYLDVTATRWKMEKPGGWLPYGDYIIQVVDTFELVDFVWLVGCKSHRVVGMGHVPATDNRAEGLKQAWQNACAAIADDLRARVVEAGCERAWAEHPAEAA